MIISNSGKTLYNGYNVTATSNYVYNSSGGTDAEDGWQSARFDHNAVAICVATLTASAIHYRIEGRTTTYSRPVNLSSSIVTSAQTIDTIVDISEHVNQIRVGVYAGNSATPNNLYCGLIQTDTK